MTLNEQVTNDKTEKFLTPKELPQEIFSVFGIKISADYVLRIRRESASRRDGLFAHGMARPSEIVEWLRANPDFKPRRRAPFVA